MDDSTYTKVKKFQGMYFDKKKYIYPFFEIIYCGGLGKILDNFSA